MSLDFEKVASDAVWDLHKEFKSDMRTLRDEEFKLADIYMKVTTLVAGALVVAMARVQFNWWLAGLVVVSLIAFLVLFLIIRRRIDRGHRQYVELRGWVDNIRRHHAQGPYQHTTDYGPSRGRGAHDQVQTLTWTSIAVFALVAGSLYMNYAGAWQATTACAP